MVHNDLEKDLIRRMQNRLVKQQEEKVKEIIEKPEKESANDLFGTINLNPHNKSDLWYYEKLMFEYGKLCYKKLWLEDAFKNNTVDWEKLSFLYDELK